MTTIEIWNEDWFVAEIDNISDLLNYEEFTDVIFNTNDKNVIWSKNDGWSEAV